MITIDLSKLFPYLMDYKLSIPDKEHYAVYKVPDSVNTEFITEGFFGDDSTLKPIGNGYSIMVLHFKPKYNYNIGIV